MQVIIDMEEYRQLSWLKKEGEDMYKKALDKIYSGEAGFLIADGTGADGRTYSLIGKEEWMKSNANFKLRNNM